MPEARSLATLLSQVLVAWTIEFDNEVEHRMGHRTTIGGGADGGHGPWLVSLALWLNFMQYVDAGGVSIRDFRRRARYSKEALRHWLVRISKRWGYVSIAPDPNNERAEPPRAEWLVRPTAGGLRAQDACRAAFPIVEERWQARFGSEHVAALRAALFTIVHELDADLPDFYAAAFSDDTSSRRLAGRKLTSIDEMCVRHTRHRHVRVHRCCRILVLLGVGASIDGETSGHDVAARLASLVRDDHRRVGGGDSPQCRASGRAKK